jgi:hypothetical protein
VVVVPKVRVAEVVMRSAVGRLAATPRSTVGVITDTMVIEAVAAGKCAVAGYLRANWLRAKPSYLPQ